MSLVVDASVAIKWFVIESEHVEALSIFDFKAELVAPELFRAEFTNVLWKKVRRSEVSVEHAKLLIERVETFITFIPTSSDIARSALEMGIRLNHPTYDCTYLVLAGRLGTKLVTADRRFVAKITEAGLAHLVMQLGDARPVELLSPIISTEDLHKIISLSARYNQTLRSVYDQLNPSTDRFSFVSMHEMQPAWDSPVRKNLEIALEKLSEAELTDLIALGWLGRGYDGADFSALRTQAQHTFADGPSKHLSYVVSILQHVEGGIASARARLDDQEKN